MAIAVDVEAFVTPSHQRINNLQDSHRNNVVPSSPWKRAKIHLVGHHPDVYEPCDDSFALVDALLADRVHLWELQPDMCVEIGCGSGYVITSLALILDKSSSHFLATDISPAAVAVTRKTVAAHNIEVDVILTDLVSGLESQLAGSVDVLIFNPPYVPTAEEDVGADGIISSWAGGDRGRTIIDRILAIVDTLMSSKGWFYLVTSTANNPGEICQIMNKKGFGSRILIQRSTEEESLHVLKFWREAVEESSDFGGLLSPSRHPSFLHWCLSDPLSRLVSWK